MFFLIPQIPILLLHVHSLFGFTSVFTKKIKTLPHKTPQFPSFPTQYNSLEPHQVPSFCLLEEELSLTFIKHIFVGQLLFARHLPLMFLSPQLQIPVVHSNSFF